jgi:peptide deformylase
LNTLIANREACVGLAANMIGVCKRIIVSDNDTVEGCLFLFGGHRLCKRYKTIKVQWQTTEFQARIKPFTG